MQTRHRLGRRIRDRKRFADRQWLPDGKTLVLSAVLHEWLEDGMDAGLSPATMQGYRLFARQVLRECGDPRMAEFTTDHVRRLIRSMDWDRTNERGRTWGPAKTSTVNRTINILKGFLRWFLRNGGRLEFDPLDIGWREETVRLPRILSQAEVDAVLANYPADTFDHLRNRIYFSLGLDTGARQQELARIRVSDIHRDGSRIRIIGKGSRERDLAVSNAMRAELTDFLRVRAEVLSDAGADDEAVPWLFPSLRGAAMCSAAIQRFLAAMSEAGGVSPPITAHQLRHTWATNKIRQGVDVFRVKELGGWSNLEIIQTYVAAASEEQRDAAAEVTMVKPGDGTDSRRNLRRRLRRE